MSKSKMRIGSILLVVAMLMTLLPAGVFAAEGDSIIAIFTNRAQYFNFPGKVV